MTGRLSGKVALVTGIGAGIGKGTALMFAREGATVVGCDMSSKGANTTLKLAVDERLAIESIDPIDLTKPADVHRYVDAAVGRHGRIDILVNAAAIAPHMAPIADMDYERQWVPTMVGEVDLVFLAVKAVWPHMRRGGGSIINFASVVAFQASTSMGMVAHCAGKGAVLAMSRQIAVEGGPHGIRCNTIAPGLVQTSATVAAGATTGEIADGIRRRLIIKRLGEPADIGHMAVFLASDESKWVTGANFTIDGGVTAN